MSGPASRSGPCRPARSRAPARGRARSGRGAPTPPAEARGGPSAHPLGEMRVPRDEAVVIDLDLCREVARAVPHEPVAERLVPLFGSNDLETRHHDERHNEVGGLLETVQQGQRVEERREVEIEVVGAVQADVDLWAVDDAGLKPPRLELVAQLEAGADHRPVRAQLAAVELRTGDLHSRLVASPPDQPPAHLELAQPPDGG